MCGRYLLKALPRQVIDFFGLIELEDFPPRYNIAPTQPIAVVWTQEGRRTVQLVRWGLVPGWVKDLSPFLRLAAVPAASFRIVPFAAELGLAAIVAALGAVGLRRRDLIRS